MLQNNAWRWLKAMSHRDNESKVRTGEASINFLFQQYSFKCPCMIIEYCPMHRYANLDFQRILTSINGSIYQVKQASSNSKGRTQCECSHIMWGLGKGHRCYLAVLPLQCKEAGSNPGCQATSGKLYHCARQAAIVLIKNGLHKKEHWSEVSLRKELLEF